ncbi:hypothetical protein N7524_007504 [Penicillium chrysogenum]|jgi:hypothetical protein|nr:hypothetical protein N7524_007504 [Penicillium chrysogenum]
MYCTINLLKSSTEESAPELRPLNQDSSVTTPFAAADALLAQRNTQHVDMDELLLQNLFRAFVGDSP